MAIPCIPKHAVEKFKQDLKDGKIDFDKLINSTSDQRRSFFAEQFGKEAAPNINALFERKILLKQQKKGMIDWIKTVAKMKPEVKRDIIARVNRMEQVLEPGDDAFLEDLAAQRLGVTVTQEEAENISKMAKEVQETEAAAKSSPRRKNWWDKATPQEKKYGASAVAFNRYMEFLKRDDQSRFKKIWQGLKSGNVELWWKSTVGNIQDSAIALKASWDASFLGRQGYKIFLKGIAGDVSSARTWTRTFFKNFEWFFNSFRGKDVLGDLRADIISDPQYDLLRKAGIATATIEEAIPTRWPERIPIIGRLFRASNDIFDASAYYMRYRVAKAMVKNYENSGADLTNKDVLRDMGKIVNSITSRGGSEQKGSVIIKAFIWAPKMIRANVDTMLLHPLGVGLKTGIGGQAAKVARRNILGIIMGQAMILGMARLVLDDDEAVELNPESTNFGKIRIGTTRIDVSGGMASYITLAVRLLPLLFGQDAFTKSSTTGERKKINENFFGSNGLRVFEQFFENKLAPLPSVLKNRLAGRTFKREKPTLKTAAENLGIPIPVTTFEELRDNPESADVLGAMLAETFGFGVGDFDHISTWSLSKLKQELKDNTYKKSGTIHVGRKKVDGKLTGGTKVRVRKGEPHQGEDAYITILNEQIGKRLAN